LDEELFTVAVIKELYYYKWSAEENYIRGALENISSKSVLVVLQYFYRIILRANISRLTGESLVAKEVKKVNQKRKKEYQLNQTQAYRKSRTVLYLLLQSQK
jgi:hypothetical protein